MTDTPVVAHERVWPWEYLFDGDPLSVCPRCQHPHGKHGAILRILPWGVEKVCPTDSRIVALESGVSYVRS
jgi:hypothetical protein